MSESWGGNVTALVKSSVFSELGIAASLLPQHATLAKLGGRLGELANALTAYRLVEPKKGRPKRSGTTAEPAVTA